MKLVFEYFAHSFRGNIVNKKYRAKIFIVTFFIETEVLKLRYSKNTF